MSDEPTVHPRSGISLLAAYAFIVSVLETQTVCNELNGLHPARETNLMDMDIGPTVFDPIEVEARLGGDSLWRIYPATRDGLDTLNEVPVTDEFAGMLIDGFMVTFGLEVYDLSIRAVTVPWSVPRADLDEEYRLMRTILAKHGHPLHDNAEMAESMDALSAVVDKIGPLLDYADQTLYMVEYKVNDVPRLTPPFESPSDAILMAIGQMGEPFREDISTYVTMMTDYTLSRLEITSTMPADVQVLHRIHNLSCPQCGRIFAEGHVNTRSLCGTCWLLDSERKLPMTEAEVLSYQHFSHVMREAREATQKMHEAMEEQDNEGEDWKEGKPPA